MISYGYRKSYCLCDAYQLNHALGQKKKVLGNCTMDICYSILLA